jgi:hypothetical protein
LLEGNGELLAPRNSGKLPRALAPVKLQKFEDINLRLLHRPGLVPTALPNAWLNLGVQPRVARNA